MSGLDDTFGAHWPRIDALRRTDKAFREILSDYEELSNLMDTGISADHVDHIRSSLAGLEDEIRAYLNLPPVGACGSTRE